MINIDEYNGNPFLIDYGLSGNIEDEPVNSTPCYEYKGKLFVENNSTKFDIYSMALTIIYLEITEFDFCSYFSDLIYDINY